MHILKGKVKKGNQRGKALGFPTANIDLTTDIPEGIYLSITTFHSARYPSLTFIGAAETFGETTRQAETYLLSFDKDIYGEELQITLLEKIRDNKKFDSAQALIDQMKEDENEALTYFRNNKILKK